MTDRELMQMALDAIKNAYPFVPMKMIDQNIQAGKALRERLSQPEPAPVAWMQEMPTKKDVERSVRMTSCKDAAKDWGYSIPLYIAPPKREWVWLTDEERKQILYETEGYSLTFAENIEAKLKEKNT